MAQTNAWWWEGSQGALLVDAPEGVVDWLEAGGRKPDLLLLTHQHYDHVEEAAAVASRFSCPVWAHSPFESGLTLEALLRDAGLPVKVAPFAVDRPLAGLPEIEPAGRSCRLAHVPGHAIDSLVFIFPEAGLAFAGDTLFAGGVGRTDFPGGSWPLLEGGIREHLLSLPEETRVLPGHGPETTVGQEKRNNPFLG